MQGALSDLIFFILVTYKMSVSWGGGGGGGGGHQEITGSLRSDVFEPRTSTGSGLFPLSSRDFEQIFGRLYKR